jgi:hypothetical protein
MRPLHKVALVAGGYAACLVLAFLAEALRVAATGGPARQAAGGMYGFGDMVLFAAVFGVSALVPTGAALYFLRPFAAFWKASSISSVAIAATGVAAAVLFVVGRGGTVGPLAACAEFSVLRIFAAPLLALAFLVCAAFAPLRSPRIAFLTASLMEAAAIATWVADLLVLRFIHGQ